MSFSPPPTRWMSPPPVYRAQSAVSNSGLTPYLQLPHLLSLTWLAYPILSLIFIAFRLLLSSDSAQTATNNAKDDLLAGCLAAQGAASSAVNMPRFMAIATNDQIADAVNASMNGAREALILSLTVMEAIIRFMVDTYRSTFLCFLELAVGGGLSLIIGATQEINTLLTNTFNSLRTSIQSDVATANSAIQTAVKGINKINIFGNITVPQFDIPSLSALQNVTLPTDFQTALTQLNASLPSVSILKNTINDLIDTPFEAVKADINSTFAGISFNSSILPVPDRSTISFCDNLDTSLIDDLGHDLLEITKIGIILIIVLVLVLLVGYSVLEWYKWQCLMRHLERTRKAWVSDPTVVHMGPASAPTVTLTNHNLLMLHADSTHPLLMRLAYVISKRLHLTPSQHINLSWFFHYVFHPPALACFLIGFFGILSVQLQLLAIAPLQAKFHARAEAAAGDISTTIFTSVNRTMFNQSALYANDINSKINLVQSTINDGLFGWVNGTTTTLNNTINAFYDDLQGAVSTLFNGTFLEQPAQEFIRCFLGSKVDAIEEALTFLNNNLHINVSPVNESVLVLSPNEVNAATQPIARAAIGGNNNPDGGLVGRLINTYVQSLKKERIMFAVFLGLWFVVVLMALAIIFWNSYGPKSRKFQRGRLTGLDIVVVPFREEKLTTAEIGPPKMAIAPLAIRPVNPSAPNQSHPLSNLPPAATRSFDSFFDQASPTEAQPPETGGGLRSLSRKLRESGWGRRITLTLLGDKGATRKSFHKAHRPQLTISTEHATWVESNSSLPEIERTSPTVSNVNSDMAANAPKSRWSADTPTIPPIHPGARRKPSVPVSVHEVDSAAQSPAEVAYAHLTVPIHYGAVRSAPARKLYIPPTPSASGSALHSPAPALPRGENPFKTPFDDDARVTMTAEPDSIGDFPFAPVSAKGSEFSEGFFATGRAL